MMRRRGVLLAGLGGLAGRPSRLVPRRRPRRLLHEIEAAEPYSSVYRDTVERNTREQQAQARPAIANPLPDLAGRTTVLLGSSIWNVQIPRFMHTFVDAKDLSGMRVLPFTTHAMSGLGGAMEEYRQSCRGATIVDGLAVRGEQVRESRPQIEDWLRQPDCSDERRQGRTSSWRRWSKVAGSTGRLARGRPSTTSRYDSVTRSSSISFASGPSGCSVIQCRLFMW